MPKWTKWVLIASIPLRTVKCVHSPVVGCFELDRSGIERVLAAWRGPRGSLNLCRVGAEVNAVQSGAPLGSPGQFLISLDKLHGAIRLLTPEAANLPKKVDKDILLQLVPRGCTLLGPKQ